ncbi:TATA box-binding protein-associated factor RNA polymerase I subunit B [Nasonia vitripennis]|uniref:Rrn7/TAF1B C-terminal cyclin domain-containing protein n=1 Tax=Nasonia vitripennis TaxID=7425 RepID=A0A7M7J2J4_NASVI|nr:TATA box-binding protein-associated factor RNA polymerase I subunit B [Nasonia vitripennis]
MFSQSQNVQRCALCNGTNFYKEAGYYFCSTCQTQNDDIREEVLETRYDLTTRLRKTKIRIDKSEKTDIIGWTSWELYNFVLIGITNELIEIGAHPDVKLTILQLWTYYLTKLEVAFTSRTKKCIPKMARRYHKKDAEIIYGKIQQKKKKKRKKTSNASASSMISSYASQGSSSVRELNKSKRLLVKSEYNKYLQSQASSDTDGFSSLNQSLYSLKSSISSQQSSNNIRIRFNKKAKLETRKVRALSKNVPRAKRMNYRKKHVTTQYASGPNIITPLKLWSIIYLALRINNQDIHLSDMLRFGREGHLSYYTLAHLLPPEITLTKTDVNLLTQTTDITHKGLRRNTASIAKFLNVYDFSKPNFLSLIRRYCEDLELPRGIFIYAERIFLSSPSVMNFTAKSALIPNYEGRAMAYIIVALKILYGLDDITEKEISRLVDKINKTAAEKHILTAKLFSFCEWQRYLECRKSALVKVHYPSKIKYDPECPWTSHLYLRFMGLMKSKRDAESPEITNFKHVLSQNLVDAMYQCIDRLNDNSVPLKEMEMFSPSFTPFRSYITQLLDNPHYDMPSTLRTNFYESKIGYVTKPDSLVDLAAQCGIKLDVVDRSLQYFEKIVPPFEQPRMPSLRELVELVNVETPSAEEQNLPKTENLLDYSHRNRPCKLKLNFESFKHYSSVRNKPPEIDDTLDFEEDSCFDKILPDGRLDIPEDSDSEDEATNVSQSKNEDINWTDKSCLLNEQFIKKYNVKLYNHEVESLLHGSKSLKVKYTRCRDEKGKFVKATERNIRENNKRIQKKEFKRIIDVASTESSEDEASPKGRSEKKEVTLIKSDDDDEVVEVPIEGIDLSDLDISILEESTSSAPQRNLENLSLNDKETLFRPYKDYWMYHCIFSRVKAKNFELFVKELPENFLWLLKECAGVVEMTSEDLYEEVCLVEGYHMNILKSKKSKDDADYEFFDCRTKLYSTNTLNKW